MTKLTFVIFKLFRNYNLPTRNPQNAFLDIILTWVGREIVLKKRGVSSLKIILWIVAAIHSDYSMAKYITYNTSINILMILYTEIRELLKNWRTIYFLRKCIILTAQEFHYFFIFCFNCKRRIGHGKHLLIAWYCTSVHFNASTFSSP